MSKQQLSLFQQGEDLPLFNREPDEYPEDYLEDSETGLPEWDDQPLSFPHEGRDLEAYIDAHRCDVCGYGIDRAAATLCRSCLNEATQELDHERARGAITFTEYQAELSQLIAKAGLNRCTYCGEPVSITLDGEIIHAECKRERNVREGFEVADWGDGSISPDEEQRRAALDHRGQP